MNTSQTDSHAAASTDLTTAEMLTLVRESRERKAADAHQAFLQANPATAIAIERAGNLIRSLEVYARSLADPNLFPSLRESYERFIAAQWFAQPADRKSCSKLQTFFEVLTLAAIDPDVIRAGFDPKEIEDARGVLAKLENGEIHSPHPETDIAIARERLDMMQAAPAPQDVLEAESRAVDFVVKEFARFEGSEPFDLEALRATLRALNDATPGGRKKGERGRARRDSKYSLMARAIAGTSFARTKRQLEEAHKDWKRTRKSRNP